VAEENQYVAVHTKGKVSVTANTSYEAAKKAAEKLNLKGTAGITVMLSKKDGKDVIHKATEEVKETHSFITNKQNEKQKKVGGEKDIVDPAPSIKKESLYDSIKSVWQMSAEQLEKIKSEAKYYKKEQNKNDLKPKKIADTGSESTPVDVEPKVDYTN